MMPHIPQDLPLHTRMIGRVKRREGICERTGAISLMPMGGSVI
jgi:hypothetical protein